MYGETNQRSTTKDYHDSRVVKNDGKFDLED